MREEVLAGVSMVVGVDRAVGAAGLDGGMVRDPKGGCEGIGEDERWVMEGEETMSVDGKVPRGCKWRV